MAPLAADLRRDLEHAVLQAREVGERGARAALQVLAVDAERAFDTLSAAQKSERTALRARMKALATADTSYQDESGGPPKGFTPLIEEVAYEQWHRMLFARFLEQNNLLIHPLHGVPVSLDECADVAADEGEPDEWMVAAKFAGEMLPGVFLRSDPSARIRFASNDRTDLERILRALPRELFLADDALGWVYQFWQTKAKEEVNRRGHKVSGLELAPVTQLFTENYMVRFLLENSLGAWWAARRPKSPLLKDWIYLRFREDGTPAGGTFPAWPERAADITVMDPCCGSGHFLVAAAEMLRKIRMEEEGLTAAAACAAVLRENVFGLELDPRCTQLATFALVFDAWKAGLDPRVRILPNVACSGIAIGGQLQEWKRLAGTDVNLGYTLERLYELFKNAPELGSLINPRVVDPQDQLFTSRYEDVGPILQQVLQREGEDPAASVVGAAAHGVERAGKLLAGQYVLVATNPPYLSRGKHTDFLKMFAQTHYRDGRPDLATMFIERCRAFTVGGGTYALVTPHTWLFLGSFRPLREKLLEQQTWSHVSRLGPGAFDTITGAVVNVALVILEQRLAEPIHQMTGIDVSAIRSSKAKADALRTSPMVLVAQEAQRRNPGGTIRFDVAQRGPLLGEFADIVQGVGTTDTPRYVIRFWEIPRKTPTWVNYQYAPEGPLFSGYTSLLRWESGQGPLARIGTAHKGMAVSGRMGVSVAVTRALNVAPYLGDRFDSAAAALIPKDPGTLLPLLAFARSASFSEEVRKVDQALSVTESSFLRVPFDLERWQRAASQVFPGGMPVPESADPTQWLFDGDIVKSVAPLQVAVARLVGYRWPDQEVSGLDQYSADDGIVSIPPLPGNQGATERLRALLASAYSDKWSAATMDDLLAGVDYAGASLERWLREGFFEQHCKFFHHRPFVWQIWDGRRDGFSALINYHGLDRPKLEKLAYSYLGSWLERQRDEKNSGIAGADDRLAAALALQQQLALILKGETPYDIFVRWKEAHDQALGWEPDIDDGVRLNIRPFVAAGVLRWRPNIKWDKDRGKNPDGTDRTNDDHLTLAVKLKARLRIGVPA